MTWTTAKLSEVATIERNSVAPDTITSGTTYVGLEHISSGGESLSPVQVEAGELSSNKFAFDADTILFGKLRPYLAKVVAPSVSGVCSTDILPIRPGGDLDKKFLLHFLLSPKQVAHVANRATGANLPRLSPKELAAMEIPLPPIEEQRRIAGILDAADALRRRRREALALLDTLPGAIFAEMFGDGEDLEKAPMKDLIEVRSSLADPTLPANADLPHVGPEHILQGGGRIEWARVQSCHEDGVTSGKYHFSAGDVIYSKIRPYLNKVAIADRSGMCSADMYALRPSSDRMTVRYLHFILGSAEFLAYGNRVSGRANIPKMNRKQLLAFDVPLPTADQQKEFERRLDAIDIERNKHVRQSSEIETLFASLQSRAFAGAL